MIGGGHAGCEAAAAAARMGARTALVTHRFATIGAMSCNPAIGGLGKGHLVREIDALDGLMGRVADQGGIQFRVLNRRKGPAVRGPRAQADRKLYAAGDAARDPRDRESHRDRRRGRRSADRRRRGRPACASTDGRELACGAVVLTTGTFLRGLIHIGETQTPAGRVGEAPAVGLSLTLERLGFALGRLKTGTPPRLDGTTIDWAAVEMQPGDEPPEPFSMLTDADRRRRRSSAASPARLPATHDIIRANVHRSPMYSGQIASRGPRYCPSIEDKIVRFGERDGHQIFLEPEGLDDTTVYPNGISTSLPEDVQRALVATIPGLEKARSCGPATRSNTITSIRASSPRRWRRSACAGLFLAGQINGTTGYEEAAAQGLVAGLNAAARAGGAGEIVFDRAEGYLGVMIDDLVTRGVTEPYRMFTSRAEYRLTLRADNADQRLTAKGIALGCVGRERAAAFGAKKARARRRAARSPQSLSITPTRGRARTALRSTRTASGARAFELLSYPTCRPVGRDRAIWPQLGAIRADDRAADRDRREIRGLSRPPGRRRRGVPARRGAGAAGRRSTSAR